MSLLAPSKHSEPLPLFGGGLLDSLFERLGIGGFSPQQTLKRTLIWISLLWLPLLILSTVASAWARRAGAPGPTVPFLKDFSLHLRFLVSLPIVIEAELFIQSALADVIPILLQREMVPEDRLPRLEKATGQIRVLRDSFSVELALLLVAFGIIFSKALLALPPSITSWQTGVSEASRIAHAWYLWVSLPLYNFLMLRWLWKYVIWSNFLSRLANLGLTPISHHPDRMGGLSFITQRHITFGILATAVSAVAAANVAELVIYGGRSLKSFESAIIIYLLIAIAVLIVPLLSFTPLLARTKWQGLVRYGDLATRYVALFDRRWDFPKEAPTPDLLGTSDIQSLSDLGVSWDHLWEMGLVLINRRYLLGLVAFVAAPLLPLLLFKIPVTEILSKLTDFLI